MDKGIYIVTGGNKGVGLEISRALLQLNYKVCIISRSGLADTNLLEHYDKNILELRFDFSHPEKLRDKLNYKLSEYQVCGIVLYAGVTPKSEFRSLSYEDLEDVFNINLMSSVLLSSWVINNMIENNIKGSIVLIGSAHAWRGEPDRLPYALTKGGLLTLLNHLSFYYSSFGIRTNHVVMGWTPTEGELNLRSGEGLGLEELKLQASKVIPMGRMTQPEDIVPVILFFLSNASEMVSGSNVRITGGQYI